MADGIKYQPTGRVFADIPSLSFANVRESFKRSESMSQSLDKLSQFAGRFAAERIEEEAEQWAVNNAYSYEQILEAQKQGITADDLVASTGGGAIWQKTVRKIQGEQLRIELEGLGRQELAGIQAAVETRQLTDPNEIAMKIDAVSKGLFAPLQSVSPEAYVKGKNAFGLHASSVYNDARKKIVNDIKLTERLKADENYQAIVELDKATIDNLSDGPALLAAKNLGAQRVFEAYAASGDTAVAYQKAAEYRQQYDKTIVNSFVKFTSTGSNAEDFKIISNIASGEFGSPEMNAKFASLDVELQDKIRETALKRRQDNFTAKEQQDKYDHFVRKEEIANNKEKLLGGDLPYNQAVELATDMHRRGDISDDLYAKIKNPKSDDEGNPELLGKLQLDVLDGRIKIRDDISDNVWSQLNPQQRKTLYNTMGNRNFQMALRSKNTYVGDAVKGTDDGKYTVGADLDTRQIRIMNEADAAGKPISAADAMTKAIAERDSDQIVLNGLAEQEGAIERIKRIPDVAKNFDKLDIDNVESFINRYNLNNADANTLRNQTAKFKDIEKNNTRKNWRYFMNKQQAQ